MQNLCVHANTLLLISHQFIGRMFCIEFLKKLKSHSALMAVFQYYFMRLFAKTCMFLDSLQS